MSELLSEVKVTTLTEAIAELGVQTDILTDSEKDQVERDGCVILERAQSPPSSQCHVSATQPVPIGPTAELVLGRLKGLVPPLALYSTIRKMTTVCDRLNYQSSFYKETEGYEKDKCIYPH